VITADDIVARLHDHHRLILTAALSPSDRARHAWRLWRQRVEFDEMDGPSMRLLPLVARRTDVVEADDPLSGRIRGLYRRAWVANERLIATTRSAREALSDARIEMLHVEALTLTPVYRDHATRPLYDIDICLRGHDMPRALHILSGMGWAASHRSLRARWQGRPHHLSSGDARLRVIQGAPWPGADSSSWSAADDGELPFERRLCLADALAHAALRAVQPWQQPAVQWVADTTRITAALGHERACDALDDAPVRNRAEVHRSTRTIRAALAAADAIVATSPI
jgi:hypothetical protein